LVHIGLCWFILVYIGSYWFILAYIGLYWFILVHIGLYWFILVYIGLYWFILVYIGLYWFILYDFVKMNGKKEKHQIVRYLTEENWMAHPSSGCIFVCSSLIIFRVSGRAESMTSLSL
jgi:hypothetical protein